MLIKIVSRIIIKKKMEPVFKSLYSVQLYFYRKLIILSIHLICFYSNIGGQKMHFEESTVKTGTLNN